MKGKLRGFKCEIEVNPEFTSRCPCHGNIIFGECPIDGLYSILDNISHHFSLFGIPKNIPNGILGKKRGQQEIYREIPRISSGFARRSMLSEKIGSLKRDQEFPPLRMTVRCLRKSLITNFVQGSHLPLTPRSCLVPTTEVDRRIPPKVRPAGDPMAVARRQIGVLSATEWFSLAGGSAFPFRSLKLKTTLKRSLTPFFRSILAFSLYLAGGGFNRNSWGRRRIRRLSSLLGGILSPGDGRNQRAPNEERKEPFSFTMHHLSPNTPSNTP
ncbi:MAG: hypothetical protein HYY44_00275 [Deltaproteobacteria bacterium]|nr:hypothetical protein [Deltaproteobacteria bacterium]